VVIKKHRVAVANEPLTLTVAEAADKSTSAMAKPSCPKCDKPVSNKAKECPHCGIFFAKFKRAEVVSEQLAAEQEPAYKEVVHPPLPWGKIIAAMVLLVVVYAGKLSIFNPPDFSIIGQSDEAQAAAQAVYQSNRQETLNIVEYLVAEDYRGLEQDLLALELDMQDDIGKESAFYFSFKGLVEAGLTAEMIERWLAHSDSIYAYTVRAAWFADIALQARGECTIDCVTEAQLHRQTKFSRLALADFNYVLEQQPDMLPVYPLLIKISYARGVRIDRREVLDLAVEQNPASYIVRLAYINKLQPRWGGSYSAMDRFAEEQQQYLPDNPKIHLLLGKSHADRAWYAKRDKQCTEGIKHMTRALEFGVTSAWAERIAWCYSGSNQPEQALKYINLSVALSETKENLWLQEVIEDQQSVALISQAL
jgi:tetratricopeptide (TPR) repeat protein